MDNNGKVAAYFAGLEYFLSELKGEQADLSRSDLHRKGESAVCVDGTIMCGSLSHKLSEKNGFLPSRE